MLDYRVVAKFPSKHHAHTLLELGCGDYLVTLSVESLEYWDLARQKRLGVYFTHFGENLLGMVLNQQNNLLLQSKDKTAENINMLFQHTKILTTEDSRIFRIWSCNDKAERYCNMRDAHQ